MGNPSTAPERAVVDRIVAIPTSLNKSNVVRNTTIFEGPPRAPEGGNAPAAAIFVLPTGGPGRVPYMGVDEDWHRYTVQVTVRGVRGSSASTIASARTALEGLHRADLASAGYFNCVVRETDPTFIGFDGGDRPRFTFNCELWHKG